MTLCWVALFNHLILTGGTKLGRRRARFNVPFLDHLRQCPQCPPVCLRYIARRSEAVDGSLTSPATDSEAESWRVSITLSSSTRHPHSAHVLLVIIQVLKKAEAVLGSVVQLPDP